MNGTATASLRNRRGIALLVTLSVMTLLVAATLEYNRRARFSLTNAAAGRDHLTMSQMAAAGVHAAMAILAMDKADNTTDSVMDDWADPLKIDEVLKDLPFEEGTVAVVIFDELAKIQVNALVAYPDTRQFNESQRALWERFLQFYADKKDTKIELSGDSEPAAIINSLKDWIDSGDDDAITGLSGAETSYYENRQPPYPARNAPIPDLGDLLMVKGITPELFYGTSQLPGIASFLTVHGAAPGEGTGITFPGRINIASAELPVLFALLPAESEELAEALDELRREIISGKQTLDVKDPNWFRQVPGMADLKLDPKLITTSSDLFRVESTARIADAAATVTALLERVQAPQTGKWTCRILDWRVN